MRVRPLAEGDARAIATWRYPGRDATYDVRDVITPEQGYWSVVRDDELIGYCCFGVEARIPGVEEEPGTLDVGYGMRPDLIGRKLGASFVSAIVRFGLDEFSPERLRILILTWNERSRKVAEKAGFHETGVVGGDEGDFLVMRRGAADVETPPAT
jgi:[ribosomal protein S18]-alanine N-acetyltransferase